MCGIVGFSGPLDEGLLRKVNGAQAHRGPDGEGYLIRGDPGVSLAMRRLSIIDIEKGDQPLSNRAGTTWVVFNGEIFNAPDIRQTLEARGTTFLTDHSDTEALVHLYDEMGSEMPAQLNGMFAFVIADLERGKLFGARDRFGIKPLYLSEAGGRLTFASELRSLLRFPWIGHDLDLQSVYDYFSFQAVPAPRSIFTDIQKLPPATAFEFDLDSKRLKTWRYWEPGFRTPRVRYSRDELHDYVRTSLESSVIRWSQSDVPVASSLSGGLDSSAVTAILARRTGRPVKTFTVGFHQNDHEDERPLARLLARTCGTEHHEIVLDASTLLDDLDRMVVHLDEPYGGGLPSWFIFKAMHDQVKVAFTGVGGDELFGNYGKWIPFHTLRRRLSRLLPSQRPPGWGLWRKGSLYRPMYFRDPEKRAVLFSPAIHHGLRGTEALAESLWRRSPSSDPRDAIAFVDLQQQLPNEFLHMVDRFSMAFSIEARTPLLDHVFVEDILAIAPSLRTHRRRLKGLLIDSVSGLLPPELLAAPKRGFVIPQDRWMRGPLFGTLREVLEPAWLREQGLFADDLWDKVAMPHLDGKIERSEQLWTILMFQLWYREFVTR